MRLSRRLRPFVQIFALVFAFLVALNQALASEPQDYLVEGTPESIYAQDVSQSGCTTSTGGLAFETVLTGLTRLTDTPASRYAITNLVGNTLHMEHSFCLDEYTLVASMHDEMGGHQFKVYDLAEIHGIPVGFLGFVLIRSDQPVDGQLLPTPTCTPVPTSTPIPSPTPQPPPPVYLPVVTRFSGPPPIAVGEKLRFLSWLKSVPLEAVVRDSDCRSRLVPDGGDPVYPDGVFVVAVLDVTNEGLESGEVGRSSLMVRDSVGRKFDMASLEALWAAEDEYDLDSVYTAIQPGFTDQLVFVFDVLPESRDLHLWSNETPTTEAPPQLDRPIAH